jgi:hypothetical protein
MAREWVRRGAEEDLAVFPPPNSTIIDEAHKVVVGG